MSRADRLERLIELLREEPGITAGDLAAQCDVSERSIFRDIAELRARGHDVETRRGIGGGVRFRPDARDSAEQVGHALLGALGLARTPSRLRSRVGVRSPIPPLAPAILNAFVHERGLAIAGRGRLTIVEPHGLLLTGSGWYLLVYDTVARAPQAWRADAIVRAELRPLHAFRARPTVIAAAARTIKH